MKFINLLLLLFVVNTTFSQEIFVKKYECETLLFYPDKTFTKPLQYSGPFDITITQKNDTPIIKIIQLSEPFLQLELSINTKKIEKLTFLEHTINSYNSLNVNNKEIYLIHFVYNNKSQLVEIGIEDSKSLLVYIIKSKNTFNYGYRYRITLLVLRAWTV